MTDTGDEEGPEIGVKKERQKRLASFVGLVGIIDPAGVIPPFCRIRHRRHRLRGGDDGDIGPHARTLPSSRLVHQRLGETREDAFQEGCIQSGSRCCQTVCSCLG